MQFCTKVSFGPSGTWLAHNLISCGWDKKTRIWNIENGKIEYEFEQDKYPSTFDIDITGTKIAVGGAKYSVGGVTVWSIRDHKKIAEIETGSCSIVKDVRFNHSGDTVAVGSEEGEIRQIKL